jgi:hypothetical protein
MKHIKLFDSMENTLYKKMSGHIFDIIDARVVPMHQRHIKLFNDNIMEYDPIIKLHRGCQYIQCMEGRNLKENRNYINYIIELKDEYFIVNVVRNFNGEDYMCDTAQGVIDLIKNFAL